LVTDTYNRKLKKYEGFQDIVRGTDFVDVNVMLMESLKVSATDKEYSTSSICKANTDS
jgi:hypothetical protein